MKRGFTLIELMMAMAILAILAGLAMPLVQMAMRQAKRSATEATQRKADAALRLFRQDVQVLPYQPTYPDAVDRDTPFPNDLVRRLGRSLGSADRRDLDALASTAANKFHYPEDPTSDAAAEASALASPLTFRIAYIYPSTHWNDWDTYGDSLLRMKQRRYAIVLNRIAQRRAMDAVMAGAFDLRGGIISGPRSGGVIHRDLTGDSLLSPADIGSVQTGWCDDYLGGEVPPSAMRGDSLLDAWGNPLVYVGQVVPPGKALQTRYSQYRYGVYSTAGQEVFRINEPTCFGLGMQGFATGTGPWSELVAAKRYRLLGAGRIQLSREDAGDSRGVEPHPIFLPSTSDLRGSDRRYYAAPRLNAEPELWSAGPDGRLAWMRSDPANRDNVAALPYDKGLP